MIDLFEGGLMIGVFIGFVIGMGLGSTATMIHFRLQEKTIKCGSSEPQSEEMKEGLK